MHTAGDARLLRHESCISGCNVACAGARKEASSKRLLRLQIHTDTQNVILIAFTLQQWLHERA
jgi:hypothetical protein